MGLPVVVPVARPAAVLVAAAAPIVLLQAERVAAVVVRYLRQHRVVVDLAAGATASREAVVVRDRHRKCHGRTWNGFRTHRKFALLAAVAVSRN